MQIIIDYEKLKKILTPKQLIELFEIEDTAPEPEPEPEPEKKVEKYKELEPEKKKKKKKSKAEDITKDDVIKTLIKVLEIEDGAKIVTIILKKHGAESAFDLDVEKYASVLEEAKSYL